MHAEKIIAIYNCISGSTSAQSASKVAAAVDVSKKDVERFVSLVQSLPCFSYGLTKSGRLRNLTISTQAAGFYGRSFMRSGDDVFYRDGIEVNRFKDSQFKQAREYADQFEREAREAGVPFIPHHGRIEALASYLAAKLVDQA
jgi:hypothetical protein